MPQKPVDIWTELNDRQRAYLQAVFQMDQAREAVQKSGDWLRRQRQPAGEWRWIPYTVDPRTGEAAELQLVLRSQKLVDPGTGSTFKALSERGLIECRWETHGTTGRTEEWLFVQMTPLGRKVIRAVFGAQREKPLPAGTLREWHWKALSMVYQAGAEGIKEKHGGRANFGGVGWNTWLRLRDYKWGSLAEERIAPGTQDLNAWPPKRGEWRIYITDLGRQYYEREYHRYRDLYPDVEAPPASTAEN